MYYRKKVDEISCLTVSAFFVYENLRISFFSEVLTISSVKILVLKQILTDQSNYWKEMQSATCNMHSILNFLYSICILPSESQAYVWYSEESNKSANEFSFKMQKCTVGFLCF